MKKLMVFGVSLIVLLLASLVSAVRVNEVMADCGNISANCEWIELYSEPLINLTSWTINTGPNQNKIFNYTINNFLIITRNKDAFLENWPEVNDDKIIEWSGMRLNNRGDNVSLFNNSSNLVSNFTYYSSSEDKSWQFCSDSWIENAPTPGSTNNCSTGNSCTSDCSGKQCGADGCGGSCPPGCGSGEICENGKCTDQEGIYLELEWDEDDIINGKEFEIEIEAFNLEDEKYNFKIWIEFEDDDTIISDRYGEDSYGEDVWRSGTYYIYNLFNGPGNQTEDVKLRIREDFEDFYGDAKLFFKLEGESKIEKDIEILEKEDEEEDDMDDNNVADNTNENNPQENNKNIGITANVIKLGNRDKLQDEEDNKKSDIIYESGSEKVKKYAIYGFNVILIVILILFIKKQSLEKIILKKKKDLKKKKTKR